MTHNMEWQVHQLLEVLQVQYHDNVGVMLEKLDEPTEILQELIRAQSAGINELLGRTFPLEEDTSSTDSSLPLTAQLPKLLMQKRQLEQQVDDLSRENHRLHTVLRGQHQQDNTSNHSYDSSGESDEDDDDDDREPSDSTSVWSFVWSVLWPGAWLSSSSSSSSSTSSNRSHRV